MHLSKCLCSFVGSKAFCEAEEDKWLCNSDEADSEAESLVEEQPPALENKENSPPKKKKKGKKNSGKGEFLLRTGKPPLRSVPLNVRLCDIILFHTKLGYL